MKQYLKFFRILFLAAICLRILNSCAIIEAPTGGTKDEAPPAVKKSNPPFGALNFKSDKIEIRFNEYIKLNNVFGQLVVSPPLEKAPEIISNAKSLLIKLKAPLKDNTTYSFNFGEAIADNNEGNKLLNFAFVLSTGTQIDSLSFSGKVVSAKDNQPVENAAVCLYAESDKDSILSKKPYYVTRANKEGAYTFKYLHEGRYHIYALLEKNQNYLYDQSSESIAFLDTTILVDTIKQTADLRLFTDVPSTTRLLETQNPEPGKFVFIFNRPIHRLKVEGPSSSMNDLAFTNDTKDSITYWSSTVSESKVLWFLTVNDTLLDTVRMNQKVFKSDSTMKGTPNESSVVFQQVVGTKLAKSDTLSCILRRSESLKILFSRPVIGLSSPKSLSLTDSLDKKMFGISLRLDTLQKNSAIISMPAAVGKYTLLIHDSLFVDFYGKYNKRYVLQIEIVEPKIGNLTAKLMGLNASFGYILQLLNSNKEIVDEHFFMNRNAGEAKYLSLPTGKYSFRVIEDRNIDGLWTTGNFRSHDQPETIFVWEKVQEIKEGWDLEVELKLTNGTGTSGK